MSNNSSPPAHSQPAAAWWKPELCCTTVFKKGGAMSTEAALSYPRWSGVRLAFHCGSCDTWLIKSHTIVGKSPALSENTGLLLSNIPNSVNIKVVYTIPRAPRWAGFMSGVYAATAARPHLGVATSWLLTLEECLPIRVRNICKNHVLVGRFYVPITYFQRLATKDSCASQAFHLNLYLLFIMTKIGMY